MSNYFAKICDHELLTFDEEKELGKKIQGNKEGSIQYTEAINKLIRCNMKLVVDNAFKLHLKTSVDVEDLFGEGYIGLLVAAQKYNPNKFNVRFATYATNWIRQKMSLYIINNIITKVASNVVPDVIKYRKLLMEEDASVLTHEEIKKRLGVTSRRLKLIEMANVQACSMSHVIENNGRGKDISIEDLMYDENAVHPFDEIDKQEQLKLLHDVLSKFTEIERDVISSQYGKDKITLQTIGKKWKLSAERIRQIRNNIVVRLRNAMTESQGTTK